MKIIKWVVNVLTTLIIILGLIIGGLYVLGIKPYIVLSGSMEPKVPTGSICFINTGVKYDNIKEKDIIAFKVENVLVTHRVVAITEEGMVTKGDANEENDAVITTKENYVGKNIYSIPKVGYVVRAIQTTKGKIIFGTVVVLLLVSAIFFGEVDKKKEKENNK